MALGYDSNIQRKLSIFFSFQKCNLQGCGLGGDVSVSRRTNVSSQTKSSTSQSRLGLGLTRLGSRLSLGAICLSLGSVGLILGLGPLRLVETFCAGTHCAYWSCN